MRKAPTLRFHEKSCFLCRYYRIWGISSECLLLGRVLSQCESSYADRARVCDGWKRRPKAWGVCCTGNPFWKDKYVSRVTQMHLRKRLGIK